MRLVTMSGAGALIDHRGGPRYGPPASSSEGGYAPLGLPRPSLGRAPAQPWRASDLTQDVSSRRQRQPAVHHERLAGDPARLVAGEIDGGPADVPRRALDAERDRPATALAHLRTEVLDHRSPHRPGRDRVDANRFRRELVRHADDEAEDAGLRRGVRGTPGAADRRHRRHARDGATAAPLEGGHGGLGREQHRLEVHGHHTVPLVLGRVHQRLARLDADVVVQHVEPAPAAEASATIASQSALWVTSAAKASAWPFSARMSPTVSSARSFCASTQSTRAPSRAMRIAAALPLPTPGPRAPAPVTIAILPASRSPIGVESSWVLIMLSVRRVRLWSGLVLFAYVTTHLANHSLGLVSLDAMEAGRVD